MHFKDYRYHPDFLRNVPGGFKSLTYSHNIDPHKALCPFEVQGGKCNERACEGQHFGGMGLSGTLRFSSSTSAVADFSYSSKSLSLATVAIVCADSVASCAQVVRRSRYLLTSSVKISLSISFYICIALGS